MVLILQWLAHRHTAVAKTARPKDESALGTSTATATRSRAAQRKPEEVIDDVADTIRKTVEGGDATPPPPLADIEFVVGVIRTFCWYVNAHTAAMELIKQWRMDVCHFEG